VGQGVAVAAESQPAERWPIQTRHKAQQATAVDARGQAVLLQFCSCGKFAIKQGDVNPARQSSSY
jgi:hypothetical protein